MINRGVCRGIRIILRTSLIEVRRNYTSSAASAAWRPLPILTDASLETFRREAFQAERPYVLPQGVFKTIPAITKWFVVHPQGPDPRTKTLDIDYLMKYGDTMLPVEYTSLKPAPASEPASDEPSTSASITRFERNPVPLALFLSYIKLLTTTDTNENTTSSTPRLYLAQAPLSALPATLHADLPPPSYVTESGRGDIYDSNLWIGIPPTYTPLHRDPNPNIFVQLAGKKVVRLMDPSVGGRVYDHVRTQISRSSTGSGNSKSVRGTDMMYGPERTILDRAVWGKSAQDEEDMSAGTGYEVTVEAGDGVFIPTGWWHSIKGVGDGVTASVNWWFR